MKKSVRQKNILIVLVIAVVLILGTMLYFKDNPISFNYYQPNRISSAKLKNYTSQDLKISFQYPRDWYIDDRDQLLLLTNYQTSLNKNDHPSPKQIELLIHRFSYCFPNIEDDLINPACGEGGIKARNKIVSKEVRQTKGGIFSKYIVSSSTDKQIIFYLLQKEDKVLQLSKQPDPSQFEREFDDIVNSITFL